MLPEEDHVVVTEPDRYYNEALTVLLIDWDPLLIEQALQSIKGSQDRIAIHIFNDYDTNYEWLLNVAEQASIISINLGKSSNNDVLKGLFLDRKKSFYFGRLDLARLFANHTDDPIGKLLVCIGDKLSQTEV